MVILRGERFLMSETSRTGETVDILAEAVLQGYLAHKKTPPPARTPSGPQAHTYGRIMGGFVFLYVRYPCTESVAAQREEGLLH